MSGKAGKSAKRETAPAKKDPKDPDLTSEDRAQIRKDQDDTDRMLGNGDHARDPMTGLTAEQLAAQKAARK